MNSGSVTLPEVGRAVTRHISHYAALLEREGPRLNGAGYPDGGEAQAKALLAIDNELENILASLGNAESADKLESLLSVARNLARYLDMTGAFHQARWGYSVMLERARVLGSSELEMHSLLGLCRAQGRLGDYASAAASAQAAKDLAASLADIAAQAESVNILGMVQYSMGGLSHARELYQAALVMRRAASDEPGEAHTLTTLGIVEHGLGNYSAAQEQHENALGLRRARGDRHGEAVSLNNLGNLKLIEGEGARAHAMYSEALAIRRDLGDRWGEAISLAGLASAEHRMGNHAAARELHLQALAFRRTMGDRWGEAVSLAGLGQIEASHGDHDSARQLHTSALELRRALGDLKGEATALADLGTVDFLAGNFESAVARYWAALEIAARLGDKGTMVLCCGCGGAALGRSGRPLPAATMIHSSLESARRLRYTFDGLSRAVLDSGLACLDTAVTLAEFTQAEYRAAQEAAQELALEDLAERSLRGMAPLAEAHRCLEISKQMEVSQPAAA